LVARWQDVGVRLGDRNKAGKLKVQKRKERSVTHWRTTQAGGGEGFYNEERKRYAKLIREPLDPIH